MRITETFWEQRNLGLKSFEIILKETDAIQDFLHYEQEIIDNGAKYIVVKIPVNCPMLLFEIPKAGYVFVEASFSLSLKNQDYVCPPYLKRFDRNLEVIKASDSESRSRIYNEILKGIFSTDRVSLDNRFTPATGNLRYLNWVKDLVDEGHGIYEVFSSGKPIGFFQLKEIDQNKVQGIVTGIYEEFSTSGLGSLIMKKLCDFVWSSGYKHYYASAVTNNLKALRSNLIFGSQITNITYNYIKHIS